MRLSFLTLLIFATGMLSAQVDSLPAKPDSAFIYPRVLRYVGSSTEIDGNYLYVMLDLVEYLKKNDDYKIHIRGHVCCGPAMKVSKKRAKKVYKYLKSQGIDKERISYKGYSDSIPAVWPEKTDEDEAMNRRVDFIICP